MLNLGLDQFLLHAALKFEVERLDYEAKTGNEYPKHLRKVWIKKLAKSVLGSRVGYDVKVFCKSVRTSANNADWVFDQYFQFLLNFKPRGDCHALDYSTLKMLCDDLEMSREYFESRLHLVGPRKNMKAA